MTTHDYEAVKQQLAAVNRHSSRADMEAADNLERRITTARVAKLKENPIQGNYDFKHLSAIHEKIFAGLYDHAGKARDFDFHKYSPIRERSDFAPASQAKQMIDDVAQQLAAKNHLKGLSKEAFVHELTPIYATINHAHPFEEGNGRATQTMMTQLAKNAGYALQFDQLNRTEWAIASSKSIPHSRMHEGVVPYAQPIDMKPLQEQLSKITLPLEREQQVNIVDVLTQPKAEPARIGRTYSGVILSRDEQQTLQKTAMGRLISHQNDQLDDLNLHHIGQNKRISYTNGHDQATVTDNTKLAQSNRTKEREQRKTAHKQQDDLLER